jgi:hypothetical protein
MNEIGRELANIVGGDPNGVFLYVEIGQGWAGPSVYKDEGDVVRYYDSSSLTLSDLLFEAWYAEAAEGNKRWSVMEYAVRDGKFEVSLKYPDEVDVEVVDRKRRQAALRAHYGDKPVVYPPPPKGAFELKP